jgi:peptidoglycan/xylan/chitin deacetylase (PgdA/CDA1 family)
MPEAIPVLMYHSIAPMMEDWEFNFLSISPEVFEDQISTLARSGFVSVTLPELHDYVSGKGRLPPKAIVLTFDDGYLDNWVYAFPILRKYGFKATVFVSTDFIDPRDAVRPTLDDVWQGRAGEADLTYRGFLSEGEMRRMLSSDLMDIQAHCRTHTWYFSSGSIVDFHHPGDRYPWLAWNERPDRKHLYLEEDQSEFVPYGSPVYEHAKAVVARRYFPDPNVEKRLAEYVEKHGGKAFFARHDWRADLRELSAEIASAGLNHRTENERERVTRLKDEIVLSRQELAELLGRPIDFLCWPGGAYDDVAVEMAREAGFKAWTLSSLRVHGRRNVPGDDPFWIRRVAATPWWYFKGRKVCAIDGEFLRHMLRSYKGFAFAGAGLRWYKLRKLLGSFLR